MRKLVIGAFLLLNFLGCTKDDICSEEIRTTPLLVIEFRDAENTLNAKQVSDLKILVNNSDSTEVATAINDTIVSIPLNTETDFSSFLFIQNGSSDTDQNVDIVTFSYNIEEVYLNRACSFKVIYHQLSPEIGSEPLNGNWLENAIVLNPDVIDETEAHITLYH
ncbi:MAG: DUF6452 family protein [Flavobacteriaceae bacterium]